MSEKFNPKDHLRTLTKRRKVRTENGEQWVEENHQYLDVKYRLMWFRQVYPDGCIVTAELEVSNKIARIEASVYDRDPNDGGKRLAISRRQIFAADFRDYVEKAETQAIGRALAVAGFGTQFCDDLDEDDTLADGPMEGNTSNSNNPLPDHSQNQSKNKKPQDKKSDPNQIYKTASRKGLTKEDANILLYVKYQHSDPQKLTAEQIQDFIQGIKETPKDRLQSFLTKCRSTITDEQNIA